MADLRIDPNQAAIEDLRELPGIGAGLAARIVAGRPFGGPDDLLAVPGLGAATLQRIRPMLVFEERPDTSAQANEEEEVEQQVDEARKSRVAPELLMPLVIGVASVLCAVSLSMAVLLGINRTLDFGRSDALQSVSAQTRTLEAELADASIELHALRQRVEVMEGVSGRMTEVENQVNRLQEQITRATGAVQEMQAQLNLALEETRAQTDRVNRFQAFLEGLQQLMSGLLADQN